MHKFTACGIIILLIGMAFIGVSFSNIPQERFSVPLASTPENLRHIADAPITTHRSMKENAKTVSINPIRDDITGNHFGSERKPLDKLLKNVDRDYPIILMDHQPFHLEEGQKNGIDLQVSGHTHHGQIFPFNFITNKVFELSWGYLQKGDTHYYVSCGVGTWGPPVRLGSRPEIIKIALHLVGKERVRG